MKQITPMQEARRRAYRFLHPPNPLQNKAPFISQSLTHFAIEEPGNITEYNKDVEQLQAQNSGGYAKRNNLHQIGTNISELFKRPVYQVHDAISVKDNYSFCSIRTSQDLKIEAQHIPTCHDGLRFQSRLESGNLALAAAAGVKSQYYLALQRDINSASLTTQWFYFRVSNLHNRGKYTFHIVNLVKPFSMFRAGMKPCVYSVKKDVGWERDGYGIEYRKNTIPLDEDRNYHSLTFSYDFTIENDEVFFAYCYPYTYTRLTRFLNELEAKHSDKLRRKTITKTLGGNPVELVTITNPKQVQKKSIIISARAHPSQTVSSFTCEALIEFFLSNRPEAEKLREQFIIKVIPMLNPDGVINGNYRCSLSGDDLNRQWRVPHKSRHPQIFHAKKLILQSEYRRMLYIDIHGHSKKRSSFMYGCVSQRNPYRAKQFPYVLHQRMTHFSYFSCNFVMQRNKEGTSRITLYKSGIENSYTYELSFCGPVRERRHFGIRDYRTMGAELSSNIASYFHTRVLQIESNLEIQQHCRQFYNDEELMNAGDCETNGSSSELEDEQIYQAFDARPARQKSPLRRRGMVSQVMVRKKNNFVENHHHSYEDVKRKVPGHQVREVDFVPNQKNIDHQAYFRHRYAYYTNKVGLHLNNPQDKLFASSAFYGISPEKPRLPAGRSVTSQKMQSKSFSARSHQHDQKNLGILTPNPLKGQYRRYERTPRSHSLQREQPSSGRIQNLARGSTAIAFEQFRLISTQNGGGHKSNMLLGY